MEVPQWGITRICQSGIRKVRVLILILMEVPQWGNINKSKKEKNYESLNPYSNGSTTMGWQENIHITEKTVTGLNPYSNGSTTMGR